MNEDTENTENTEEKRMIVGHVKWFDPSKGFGFVVSEDGGPDILLHANVLRNFGQSSVADAAEIEILIQETERGIQAVEILSIQPPLAGTETSNTHFEPYDLADQDLGELLPARVKWFDKGKGFGFANIFGNDEDVFVHVEILRQSGLADLQPGEAICLRVVDGERGRMAAQVSSWEQALKGKE